MVQAQVLAGQHAKFHVHPIEASHQRREKTVLCVERDRFLAYGERRRLVVLVHVFWQYAVYLAVFGIPVLFG